MARNSDEYNRIHLRSKAWFPDYRPAHEVYFDTAKKYFKKETLILHLGSGLDSHNIADKAEGARLISLDISEEALRKNKNYLRICSDALKLPFKSGVFDIIMCENVFEHIIDPKAVLGESYRVLKNQGRLVFLTPNALSYISILSSFTPYWFHRKFRKFINKGAGSDTYPTYYLLNTFYQIRKLSKKVGFEVESLESYVGWPSYWEFSETLHKIMCVVHKVIERFQLLHITMIGILRKSNTTREVLNR